MNDPTQPDDFDAIWPQGRLDLNCFATLSMDSTASFLSDMGLCTSSVPNLRSAIRRSMGQRWDLFSQLGLSSEEAWSWQSDFSGLLAKSVDRRCRAHFWGWIRDTFTMVPADRPNWEMYEMFFFRWSVDMRDGEDTAKCFERPGAVYDAHHVFTRGRRLTERIADTWKRDLSEWDRKVFVARSYAFSENEINSETRFDPFAVVEATAERNYFQEFWEYLLPLLSQEEQVALEACLRRTYEDDFRLPSIVAPAALSRQIR